MKILHINTRYSGGGGASYIANLVHTELNDKENIESKFIYGRGAKGDCTTLKISNSMYEKISAGYFRMLGNYKSLFTNKKNIIELIREADIIHIHNLHGYYIDYSWLIDILVRYNKKIVWTVHDLWLITGRCAFMYSDKDCYMWKRGCLKCNNKDLYPKSLIHNESNELNKKIKKIKSIKKENIIFVAPSIWVKSILKDSYLKEYNIEVINNAIKFINPNLKTDEIKKKYNIDKDKAICLVVAANVEAKRKGIKDLIKYINMLEDDILIVTVGQKLELENKIKNKVIQLGYIYNRNELYEIYKVADLYINPAYAETFSLTTLEAMANGTPTISFDIGPLKELTSEDCGITVSKGNFNDMMTKINNVSKDYTKVNDMKKNCENKFNKNYNLDKMIYKYINLYKHLINK